jgi:phosphoribosyl-AMP cyclohydrolase
MPLIDTVKFDANGLVPAVAQDARSGEVLMLGWMTRETFLETIRTGLMVYFSRSRKSRWQKGETSGHLQRVRAVYLDCDGDTLLFKVDQTGAACHENYFSCFFRENAGGKWRVFRKKVATP